MLDVRFDQIPNTADWSQSVEITDNDTGALIDLSGYTITLWLIYQSFRGPGTARPASWDYYAPGSVNTQGYQNPVLEASTSNGKITIDSTGVFTWNFSASDLQPLAPGVYELGAILSNGTSTTQILLGTVPLIEGIVRP